MAEPDDPLTDAVTRAVGEQFSIERLLGRGGMGVVYLARDRTLDRLVALKVLPLDVAADSTARERFLREARTAAHLAHPNIVPVYHADEIDGIAFFAMAYVEGESLADRIRDRGSLPAPEAVRILREVAWALAYAHARGVVHRDVKPENVMIERGTGRSLVTDFGIAHRSDLQSRSEELDIARLTMAGTVLGTLHYMSPEQLAGDPLDGRSDLYSLGVVGYAALSGRLPFDDLAGSALILAQATRLPRPLTQVSPSVPIRLATVVDRCLAKRPEDRYPTGEALAEALERALSDGAVLDSKPEFLSELPPVLSEREASALWRRAAQLQADALRRLETSHDLLDRTGAGGATVPRDPTRSSADTVDSSDYAREHVLAAAAEAGISAQYVAMAVAELARGARAPDGSRVIAASAMGVSERTATLLLGTQERSLAVSHVVSASAARTLRALGAVLQQLPFELRLRETVGPHPLDGGVIVFDLPNIAVGAAALAASSVSHYWMGARQQLEAHQFHVTLRRLPGDVQRTEVTMACDIRPGVRSNVRASQWLSSVLGGGASLFAGAVAAKGAAVVLSAVVLGPAAAAGVAAAGATMYGFRRMYPRVLRKARAEMSGALDAVAAAVHSEDLFGTESIPASPPRRRDADDDSGAAAAMVIIG